MDRERWKDKGIKKDRRTKGVKKDRRTKG